MRLCHSLLFDHEHLYKIVNPLASLLVSTNVPMLMSFTRYYLHTSFASLRILSLLFYAMTMLFRLYKGVLYMI